MASADSALSPSPFAPLAPALPPCSNVVAHVCSRYPRSQQLFAAGWSLGANIMCRYLGGWVGVKMGWGVGSGMRACAHMCPSIRARPDGVVTLPLPPSCCCHCRHYPLVLPLLLPAGEEAERAPISAAVAMCNPFDLPLSDANFQKGFNRVYDANLARSLGAIYSRHHHLFEAEAANGGRRKPRLRAPCPPAPACPLPRRCPAPSECFLQLIPTSAAPAATAAAAAAYKAEMALKAKSIREFDDAITRLSFGWPSGVCGAVLKAGCGGMMCGRHHKRTAPPSPLTTPTRISCWVLAVLQWMRTTPAAAAASASRTCACRC